MRKEKGITLIALVITIIVLLILAGVTIAMLTGDNGILTKTKQAKKNTTKGEEADKINMALNAEYANILSDGKMSGATGSTIATADEIAKTNGITTSEFTITPGATMTDATVLTITSKTYSDVTGKITYADGKYTVEKAKVK
mgnify:CR=1 FL=1